LNDKTNNKIVDIHCFSPKSFENGGELSVQQISFLRSAGFNAKNAQLIPFSDEVGEFAGYAFAIGEKKHSKALVASLAAAKLPYAKYQLLGEIRNPNMAALGFLLGGYKFDKYKELNKGVILAPLVGADMAEVKRLSEAAFIARDLINIAPNDLNPSGFEKEVRQFATKRKMQIKAVVGDDLLKQNFPMVHAVGKASSEAPRLLDLTWGNENDAKVTLVGKGVTFDSGGLSIKHAAGMLLMKKDMGGAANVLGLAHAIIDAKLKIRLRVILPIVENAISSNAFRPGDVLPSRAGINVEIGNTDAEGRLILADALSLADEESPQLLFDMATLTGAARVALGTELPPLYCDNKKLVRQLLKAGKKWDDPLWQMPLYQPYEKLLDSKVADINHITSGGFAGSVTAALFLQKFVKNTKLWAHLDIYGWSPSERAGRSYGGTDQGIRAIYQVLKDRFF